MRILTFAKHPLVVVQAVPPRLDLPLRSPALCKRFVARSARLAHVHAALVHVPHGPLLATLDADDPAGHERWTTADGPIGEEPAASLTPAAEPTTEGAASDIAGAVGAAISGALSSALLLPEWSDIGTSRGPLGQQSAVA